MKESIWDYWAGKLLLPKTYVVDKPGIIISKASSKFSSKDSKRRMVFFFEDVIANLQKETISALGKKKAGEIWYELGEKTGARYMHTSKAERPSLFLLPIIVTYIFKGLCSGGLSLAKNINYNSQKKTLTLTGDDNMVCRKSGDPSFFMGIINEFQSFLSGEKMETKIRCKDCPRHCRIICKPCANSENNFENKDSNKGKFDETKNFPEINKNFPEFYSFKDLVKFKKILIDDSGKFNFKNNTVVVSESGVLNLIMKQFYDLGHEDIAKKGVVDSSEKVASNLLSGIKGDAHDKLDYLKKVMCAFGWGIPKYKIEKEKTSFIFLYPPVSEYGFLYPALVLQGFLNYVFNKKFKIDTIKTDLNLIKTEIVYSRDL